MQHDTQQYFLQEGGRLLVGRTQQVERLWPRRSSASGRHTKWLGPCAFAGMQASRQVWRTSTQSSSDCSPPLQQNTGASASGAWLQLARRGCRGDAGCACCLLNCSGQVERPGHPCSEASPLSDAPAPARRAPPGAGPSLRGGGRAVLVEAQPEATNHDEREGRARSFLCLRQAGVRRGCWRPARLFNNQDRPC